MKLFDLITKFRRIEPDRDFSERSRREILLSPRPERLTTRGVFAFLHIIETGAAVALAGLFIFILAGGFSSSPDIAPIQPAVIDPAVLHAEAQAIDMQIQLADVEYAQATSAAMGSTPATKATLKSALGKAIAAQATSSASAASAGPTSTAATSTTPMGVDQALQQLSH